MCEPQSRDPEEDRESFVDSDDTLCPPTQAWTSSEMQRGLVEPLDPNKNGRNHCICPPKKKGYSGDTSTMLQAVDLRREIALDTPEEKRTRQQQMYVTRLLRERQAEQYPFVHGICNYSLKIRDWGIALDRAGAPQNVGECYELQKPANEGKLKVWVVNLKAENHDLQAMSKDGGLVECTWSLVQKNGSGDPIWLYFSVGKSHNLSFHSKELRLETGKRREVLMVNLTTAVRETSAQKKFLPITIRSPFVCRVCNPDVRHKLGEYSLEVTTSREREHGPTTSTIVLRTVSVG